MKIQELITNYKEQGLTDTEIASKLSISQPMVSQYKKGYNASLDLARRIFKIEGIVLYPFRKEAVDEDTSL